jgi:hypothetical protein
MKSSLEVGREAAGRVEDDEEERTDGSPRVVIRCEACVGTGVLETSLDPKRTKRRCPVCRGRGNVVALLPTNAERRPRRLR